MPGTDQPGDWMHRKEGNCVSVEKKLPDNSALMVGIKTIRFERHGTGPVMLNIETDKGFYSIDLAFGANTFRIGERVGDK